MTNLERRGNGVMKRRSLVPPKMQKFSQAKKKYSKEQVVLEVVTVIIKMAKGVSAIVMNPAENGEKERIEIEAVKGKKEEIKIAVAIEIEEIKMKIGEIETRIGKKKVVIVGRTRIEGTKIDAEAVEIEPTVGAGRGVAEAKIATNVIEIVGTMTRGGAMIGDVKAGVVITETMLGETNIHQQKSGIDLAMGRQVGIPVMVQDTETTDLLGGETFRASWRS